MFIEEMGNFDKILFTIKKKIMQKVSCLKKG